MTKLVKENEIFSVSDDLNRLQRKIKEIFLEEYPKFEDYSKLEQNAYSMVLRGKKEWEYISEITTAFNSGVARPVNTARCLGNIKYRMNTGYKLPTDISEKLPLPISLISSDK
ncbi:hypothetical protein A3K64_03075 [Candidatus Micrarchaeota archaeon RBG_16_36_9]|nr:MAG: hypothetical protein A3K64_03075 [Candidatus Micrarchaeota archaeon RBG_16_36_9]